MSRVRMGVAAGSFGNKLAACKGTQQALPSLPSTDFELAANNDASADCTNSRVIPVPPALPTQRVCTSSAVSDATPGWTSNAWMSNAAKCCCCCCSCCSCCCCCCCNARTDTALLSLVPPTMAGVAAAATAAATAAAADTGRPTGRGRGGGGGSRGVPLPTAAKGNRTTAVANGVPLPDPVPLLEATASEVALPTPPRGISTGSKYGTATMGGPVARPVADDETTGPSNRKSSRRVRSTEGRVGGGSS